MWSTSSVGTCAWHTANAADNVARMQDTVIMADITFAKLLENLKPKLRTVREIIFLTDER